MELNEMELNGVKGKQGKVVKDAGMREQEGSTIPNRVVRGVLPV